MPNENEVTELARQLVERHGPKAANVAALWVSNLERRGDPNAAQVWRRVQAVVQRASAT